MDSPSPPLLTAQVNAALSSYKEKMAGENEQSNVSGHVLVKFVKVLVYRVEVYVYRIVVL